MIDSFDGCLCQLELVEEIPSKYLNYSLNLIQVCCGAFVPYLRFLISEKLYLERQVKIN